MANVKIESNRYTVELLYQWDKDQDLIIRGLSLASIPEIHFTNDAMDKAIVKQATMDNTGVITARIPNSLLQKAYKIKAYVCIYEGDTFKSLYTIEIPVKARTKPADYTLENDSEVYSFNALENKVENALKALYADRADTLSAVNDATNEAINTLNNNNETFLNNLKQSNEANVEALKQSNKTLEDNLTEKYSGYYTKEDVNTLLSKYDSQYLKVTDIASKSGKNLPFTVMWGRQGNLMSVIIELTLEPGVNGTLLGYGLLEKLNKPDWFLLPDLQSVFYMRSNVQNYNDNFGFMKNTSNEYGYSVLGALDTNRANETETMYVSFSASYIVADEEKGEDIV